MPAVDFHQHLWPESLIRALERRSAPPLLRGSRLELTVEPAAEVDLDAHLPERRLALLDRDGIDVAVLSPAPTLELEGHEDLHDAYHEGIAELVRATGGRFVALSLGVCLPDFAGACVSTGALQAGIGPLLAELRDAGQLLFVHPGPPAALPPRAPSWWPAVVDYTAQMQAAYAAFLSHPDEYADVPIVFAMLAGGGPFQLERLRSRGLELRTALRGNVYLETSSYGRRALELCLATFGVTQLLYGSDAPVIDPRAGLEAVLGFGKGVTDMVLDETPSRLLGLLS